MAPDKAAPRVVLCACLLMGTIAHAERRPVVVVDLRGDLPSDPGAKEPAEKELAKLVARIRTELANHEQLSRILEPNLETLLVGDLAPDEDTKGLEEARRDKEAAENALAEFKFSDAADRAAHGMDQLKDVNPSAAIVLHADLAFVLGQARLGEKKPDLARLAFAFAHRLHDKRRVDPSRYLPEVVAAYEKAQPAPPTLSVEVRGTGRVWIDGVAVGDGEGTYKVGAGIHVVQLAGPDRQPRGIRFTAPHDDAIVIDDAPASTELKIQRARRALAHAMDPTDRATAMKHLAELTKVKDAVLVWSANGKLMYQSWRDSAPGYDASVFLKKETFNRDDSADQVLLALAPRKKPPKLPDKPIVIPPEPVAWYRKPWVTGSVIGSVIAIVGGAIVWSQRGAGHIGLNNGIGFDEPSSTRPR